MASRNENTVLAVGPGPVTLDQGAGFQHLAARVCRHLRKKGRRVVVLEDNPATLMDIRGGEGDLYLEPPLPEVVARVAEDCGAGSIWLGTAGRRGWRLAIRMAAEGWFEKLGITVTDLDDRLLWTCGDRSLMREILEQKGLPNPASQAVAGMREAQEAAAEFGFPLVVRPHFSSGGWGAGMAYNMEELPNLVRDALRESPSEEILLEEALVGWRKYIACVLRDKAGKTEVAELGEQLEPLPVHDEDAVVLIPPLSCGGEIIYALQEISRQVADVLGTVGVAEVKLAVSPGCDRVYVLDVNPGPRRLVPLLEMALGEDLVGAHVDIVCGARLGEGWRSAGEGSLRQTCLALPRFFFPEETEGEGYLALRCRAVGRTVLRGRDTREAAEAARRMLENGGKGFRKGTREVLEDLLRRCRRGKVCTGFSQPQPSEIRVLEGQEGPRGYPQCLALSAETLAEEGIMFVAVDEPLPGGSHEHHFNLYHALRAWREQGGKAAVYVSDPGFGLLLMEEADAVFLGPPCPKGVAEALVRTGIRRLCPHFGNRMAFPLAQRVKEELDDFELLGQPSGKEGITEILASLRSRGLSTVPFAADKDEVWEFLRTCRYPVHVTLFDDEGKTSKRLFYEKEEAEEYLSSYPGVSFLVRELREESQEILVEAVAAREGIRCLLLWERLQDPGDETSEGLALYPPADLTSEQARGVEELVREAVDHLGWTGNLSLRLVVDGDGARLWDVSPGASADLPFLSRASFLCLPELGFRAIMEDSGKCEIPFQIMSSVRYPIVPLGIVTGGDSISTPCRRSTGVVMGMGDHPGMALAKILWSLGMIPRSGRRALLSVANREKRRAVLLARELSEAGYILAATRGTARALRAAGLKVEVVNKLREGRPNVLDHLRNGHIDLVVNIPRGRQPYSDGFYIREDAARHGIPCITDMEVALALVRGMRAADPHAWEVKPLVEYMCGIPGKRGG